MSADVMHVARTALAGALWLAAAACGDRGAPAPARADSVRRLTTTTAAAATGPVSDAPATCADSSESRAIAACAAGRARRVRDTLVLDVAGGRPPLRLADDSTDSQGFVAYTFTGTVLGGRYYVLDVRGYENGWVMLVDAVSGESVEITSAPVPSPDGAHLAAAARSLEIAEGATRLEIWRVQPGKPVLEFELQPYDQMDDVHGWGPGDPRWRGPDTLAVPRFFVDHASPAGESVRDTALVVWDGRAWRLAAPAGP